MMNPPRSLQGEHRRQKGDPFRESRIQRVIKEARATLAFPTRPETPQDRGFYAKGLSSRQNTPVSLLPIDSSFARGGGGGAPAAEPPAGGGTPGMTAAKVKAAQSKTQYFSLPQAEAAVSPLHREEAPPMEDPRFRDLAALVTLVETEHSISTLREGLVKVNECVDQVLSTMSFQEVAESAEIARMVRQVRRVLTQSDDATIQVRGCRVLLKTAVQLPATAPLSEAAHETVAACVRMLYHLSKHHEHDSLFRSESVIEPVLLLLDSPALDVVTLAAGVAKNISHSRDVQQLMGTLGAIRVMTTLCRAQLQHIEGAAEGGDSSGGGLRSRVDLVIQLTGCLRNLSLVPAHAHLFTKLGTVSVLYPATFKPQLRGYRDIVLNTSRILAKLSHTDDCKMILDRDEANVSHMIDTLMLYEAQHPIAVRLLYTLGNLVQTSEDNRLYIGQARGGKVLQQVMQVFATCAERDAKLCEEAAEGAGWPQEVGGDGPEEEAAVSAAAAGDSGELAGKLKESDDLLVKAVRLLANLAISEVVGPALAAEEDMVRALLALLQRRRVEDCEELVLNAVCCVTNMSYYAPTGAQRNVVCELAVEFGGAVSMLLMHDHVDAVVEAARLYGNYSREADVREWMLTSRVYEACAILVDHSDRRVVLAVCGVLLNYSADDRHVAAFEHSDLVQRVHEVLDVAEPSDLELLTLLFKLHYNLADKGLVTEAASGVRSRALQLVSHAQSLPAASEAAPLVDEFIDVATNTIDLLAKIVAAQDEEDEEEEGDEYAEEGGEGEGGDGDGSPP
eukprot:Rhum_TRINITY_DN3604_c0_g1::Rhum_TRINITY_DN3604_c0_g1_i1::g.11441::m.11441